jgi:FeS assembly ATPase SufC
MGPNGSGKSTLSSVLAGREAFDVTAGEVNYKGMNLLEMAPEDRARNGIFLGFQYPVEIPGVSNVNFMKTAINEQRKYKNLPPLTAAEFLKLMREKMAVVEMDNSFSSRGVNVGFSGGEKKLASIATILSTEPDVILMDEPSVALDPKNRRNLINILNQLNQAKIIASHDLNMIMDTCERTILLSDGKVIKDGNTKEILLDKELMEESGLELPLGY